MNDDTKTRIIRRDDAAAATPATKIIPPREAGPPVTTNDQAAQETRRINVQLPPPLTGQTTTPPAPAAPAEPEPIHTRLYRPGAAQDPAPAPAAPAAPAPAAAPAAPQTQAEWDPVTGWLVITAGPGKGNAIPLGIGQNTLGRAPGQRARVDYGDATISRETHAIVTFDPKGGKFYIANSGHARNLVYLNKSPVLQFSELKTGDEIEIGNTTLRFCAFCSEQFKWDNQ